MKSTPTRFLDESKDFWAFAAAVDVVCPRCGSHGVLRRRDAENRRDRSYSFVCRSCVAIDPPRDSKCTHFSGFENGDPPKWIGYALWRVTRCRGKVLWALNREHCAYLRTYIQAELRERVMERYLRFGLFQRMQRVSNGFHVVSRLPRWMVLKSSRPHVLRGLAKLEAM